MVIQKKYFKPNENKGFFLFCVGKSFAVSSIGQYDNVIGITLKNKTDCFYLENNANINSIYIATKLSNGYKQESDIWFANNFAANHSGNQKHHCISAPQNRIMANQPYEVLIDEVVNHHTPTYRHIRNFCIRQTGKTQWIAEIDNKQYENGRIDFFCSDTPLATNQAKETATHLHWWEKILHFFHW